MKTTSWLKDPRAPHDCTSMARRSGKSGSSRKARKPRPKKRPRGRGGPKISLCMIVRDEAAHLGPCLESARHAVDEVVVVDTGSADHTMAVAREAGARVFEHPWQEDFSAPRNEACQRARGDFVLLLDADERLAPGAGAELRNIVGSAGFECGLVALHNADRLDASVPDVVRGAARAGEPILLPRVFRRTPDLSWEGVVHEMPRRWLARPERSIVRTSIEIAHYGAIPELRRQLGKNDRNLRLLEKRCARHADDTGARTYLARELVRRGDHERARAEVLTAWRGALAQPGRVALTLIPTATLAAFLLLADQQPTRALEVLDIARQRCEPHPNLELLTADAHYFLGMRAPDSVERSEHLRISQRHLEACRGLHGRRFAAEVLPGATSEVAATKLAIGHVLLGAPARALRLLEPFEASLNVELTRGEALVAAGNLDEAKERLGPLLSAGSVDAAALLAAASLKSGDAAAARRFRAICRGQPLGRFRAAHRAALGRELDEPALREHGIQRSTPPPAIGMIAESCEHGEPCRERKP